MSRAEPLLVSFVIPNYNHARYLGAAVASALAQTHQPIEVIVVDDGSKDDSAAVAAAFGDKIRYIYQQNQGLSAARNTGVQAAQGDYIALLDADDVLEPTYVERLLAVIAADGKADGAYCGFRFVDQNNAELPQIENRVLPPDELFGSLLNGNYWVPESALLHRRCYAAMGTFDIEQYCAEDWDVWLRMSRHYRIIGTTEVLIRYRVVTGSMSSDPLHMHHGRLRVLGKHIGPQPVASGNDPQHLAYANAYLRTAIHYLQNGDDSSAYAMLHQAAAVAPAILQHVSTFYELAYGAQERGSRGAVDGATDVRANEQRLHDWLDRLLAEPELRQVTAEQQRSMRAQADLALGMVFYRQGDLAAARTALLRAGRQDFTLARQKSYLGWLGRAIVGAPTVARIKRTVTTSSSPDHD